MKSVLSAYLLLLPAALAAEPLITPVCYARDYSAEHLAANPAQVVQTLRVLAVEDAESGTTNLLIAAGMANQGHVVASGHAGQVLRQSMFCDADSDGVRCAIECDGGALRVLRDDGEVFEFETDHLTIGEWDECGGPSNLAETIGQSVTYRLFAADAAACAGLQ